MSDRRQVWETLCNLLARVDESVEATLDANGQPRAALEKLEKEIRRLGKAHFKTSALAEAQAARWERAVPILQATQEERDQLLESMISERVAARERELLEAVLPALDGLDNAIVSGQRYLAIRDRAAASVRASGASLTPAQAVLVSPADQAILAGWLDGLRLVRHRLLAVLEAGGVMPIPAVGRLFDPYLHVAVGITTEGEGPAGAIVAEERRGYRSPAGVLRYAEVVVYRPAPENA